MRYRLMVTLLLLLLAVILPTGGACHTNQSRPISGGGASTSDRRAQESTQTPKNQHGLRVKSASPPRIVLSGRVVKQDAVAIVVANHESSEVRLTDRLEVERHTAEGWKAFGAQDLRLRDSCDTKVDGCVALLPGAELYPPPWQVASGPSQCRSHVGASAPAGRYRFVVKGCDRALIVYGEAFQIPSAYFTSDSP